jgi:anti-sigma regulatory factor (Ser/Thr protein kinase)
MMRDTDPQRTVSQDGAVQEFAAETVAPARARMFVVDVLNRWGRPDLVDDAMLVVSELATNAVIHCHSSFSVQLLRRGSQVRVEVIDESGRAPAPTTAGQFATSGRGLSLVEAVSQDWGFERIASGKSVWAELDATV